MKAKNSNRQRFPTKLYDVVKVMKKMSDQDYYISRDRAQQLLEQGKLFFDAVTNECYMQVNEYDNFNEGL